MRHNRHPGEVLSSLWRRIPIFGASYRLPILLTAGIAVACLLPYERLLPCYEEPVFAKEAEARQVPLKRPFQQDEGVAVCLAGGLRSFELTVESLVTHFFGSFPEADVFLHAPLDENSHKLLLLMGLGLGAPKAVKLLPQSPLRESQVVHDHLDGLFYDTGNQRIMQYYELVEGCLDLMRSAELKRGFRYDWVVRSRPDAFWSGPAPPLSSYDPHAYTLPQGSEFWGVNDRLGICRRDTAELMLRRLSLLEGVLLAGMGLIGPNNRFNSEHCLKIQLQVAAATPAKVRFPFCVLSTHGFQYPPQPGLGVPVLSLTSTEPMGGAYCRPCPPALSGPEAMDVLSKLWAESGLPFVPPLNVSAGFDLCRADGNWSSYGVDWEKEFDAAAGERAAHVRQRYAGLTYTDCVAQLRPFLDSVDSYEGPSVELLCKLKLYPPLSSQPSVHPRRVRIKDVALKPNGSVPSFLGRINYHVSSRWCQVVVPLNDTSAAAPVKARVVRMLQKRGFVLLKCFGTPSQQDCVLGLENKCPLERSLALIDLISTRPSGSSTKLG